MKRFFAIFLLLFVFANMLSVAFADTASTYASRVFRTTVVPISISGGVVEVAAYAEAISTATQLGVKSLAIQVKNGSSWSNVKIVSGSYVYNKGSYSKTITCSATSGKQYRARVTFYGKVNGVTDTVTMNSVTKTAP